MIKLEKNIVNFKIIMYTITIISKERKNRNTHLYWLKGKLQDSQITDPNLSSARLDERMLDRTWSTLKYVSNLSFHFQDQHQIY